MNLANLSILILTIFISTASGQVEASIERWFKNEVIPTITGKRPLRIDPNHLRISDGGKDIINYSGNSLKIQLGSVSVTTKNLREDLIKFGAIMSGNTAVLTAVATEQAQQLIRRGLENGSLRRTYNNQISVVSPPNPGSQQPSSVPPNTREMPRQPSRAVTLYNLSGGKINYALNDKIFSLDDDHGFKHTEVEHYLQIDTTLGGDILIGRWFLRNSDEYFIISIPANADQRQLVLCTLENSASQAVCYTKDGLL